MKKLAVLAQLIYFLLVLEELTRFERLMPPVNPKIVSHLSIRNTCSTTNITCIILIYLASEIVPRMSKNADAQK